MIVSISHYHNNNNNVMAFKPVPPPSPSIPPSDNNLAPTANARTNQIVNENTLVTLVGVGSDPNPNDIITYSWRQISGPAVELNDIDTPTPSFTAPSVSSDTELVFSLTIKDDNGAHSNIARVSVTVKNINNAPTANAGIDQNINEGYVVSLDGTASTDPDNDQLSYTWTQTEGPSVVVLNDANSAISRFTAPSDLSEDTELVFSLTVKDDKGNESSSDTVNIIVKSKITPSAKKTTTDEKISNDETNKQEQKKSYQFIKAWGDWGSDGIAVDSKGNVYVTDSRNHRIQKFDSNGNFITKWGSEGNEDGKFQFPKYVAAPSGIAVDSKDNLYVVDSGNDRIQKFDSNGNFITKWQSEGNEEWKSIEKFSTKSISIDSDDNVYVTDSGLDHIQKFDSDGNFITKWGNEGNEDGKFKIPDGIAVDSNDNVYVTDLSSIHKFDSNGNFITKWESPGNEDVKSPTGIAVDSNDNVYVTDDRILNIQKFDSNGNFITKWGSPGRGDGEFMSPFDIAVDSSTGNVYVSDFNNGIQVFAPFTK